MDNSYRIVSLEEFVKGLPLDQQLLCVSQRQSLRSLVPDVINLIQSQQGDTRSPSPIEIVGRLDSIEYRSLMPLADRKLVYKGEEHPVLRASFNSSSVKEVFEAIPDVAIRTGFSGTMVLSSLLTFPTGQVMVMKTVNLQPDAEELWVVTAFEIEPNLGFDKFTITDAKGMIQPIVKWLHRFNLTPVRLAEFQALGAELDPWIMSEETYMDLLSKNSDFKETYQAMMAVEMLGVRQGIKLVKPIGPTCISYLYFPRN